MAVRDLMPGDKVESIFALRKLERRTHAGGERLSLELGDASGRIDAIMWRGYEGVIDQLATGQIVKVRGVVGEFRDRPQITVEKIRPARDGEADPADFVARAPVDPRKLADEFDRMIASLTNPHLRALMERMFADEKLRAEYLAAAGAKLWHHSTIGGLAEHSLNVARICEFACELYGNLDRDLLVCGALLHDIGKIEQYHVGAMIDYSDEGRLVGHINSGDFRVTTAIREIEGFPAETERVLRHLIVSHQGAVEFGSPVLPQTPEAFVLCAADDLDAKMGGLLKVAEKAGDSDWSDWVNLLNRFIYFGHRKAHTDEGNE